LEVRGSKRKRKREREGGGEREREKVKEGVWEREGGRQRG
jgi:hypothetical protein